MTGKSSQTKKASLFSFFLFYYYILTKNPKQYKLLKERYAFYYILLTPAVFLVIQLVIGLAIDNTLLVYLAYIYVILIPGTMIVSTMVQDEGWDIERRERKRL